MAKKTAKKSSARKTVVPNTEGKHLVIVESPTKAKTINKYLGSDYAVMASVGHVRDLPARAPKGVKQPVPGVDLEHDFKPTYEIMPDKKKVVSDLKKAAKQALDVWFATDLDREGEAIAWHLAHALSVPLDKAKRVVFNAITKAEISHAFSKPRPINEHRVNAQQARRILDRIVGYQVSPLLWKKVAGGLSAGRVQSVGVRLVVEREREIEAFVPEEHWRIQGVFALALSEREALAEQWVNWFAQAPEDQPRIRKQQVAWLSEHQCMQADLVEIDGQTFKPNNRDHAIAAAQRLGFMIKETKARQDPKAKGPAQSKVVYVGDVPTDVGFAIKSIETRRTRSKPSAPFITSTLQQAASNRLGFPLQRTMRIAQQLYEGIDIKGKEGQSGLITYMRTDSTHLSPEAINMARSYVSDEWGDNYLPDKPNFYTSSNKQAQEAHEAIRPTDATITPKRVRDSLTEEQFKLYQLIWERFLGSQMVPAQWDATTVLVRTKAEDATFKATGRTLIFDGHYRATGIPKTDDPILPALAEGQLVAPIEIDPTQHFTSPPPRYNEASLQKKLEEEGIGRPSTYAAIIQTIQDRKYVQPIAPRDRRLYATDLGKVVTDKLIEGFPKVMDIAYTSYMEGELDKIESADLDWVEMLHSFYGPFKANLEKAHEVMTHAKAEMQPAPFKCDKCGSGTAYRFGKNGRFLSCDRYPDCDYAAPVDREGNPQKPEISDICCPICQSGMTRRAGRFGPFLGCENYPTCKGIVKLDPKKQTIVLPKTPPMIIDVPCPKCDEKLNMRDSKRGYWLSCSKFPKCRGRLGFKSIEEKQQATLEKAWQAHVAENPLPELRNTQGKVVPEGYEPVIESSEPAEPQA